MLEGAPGLQDFSRIDNPDLEEGVRAIDAAAPAYERARLYADGQSPELFLMSEAARRAVTRMIKDYRLNFAALPIRIVADRLSIMDFRGPDESRVRDVIERNQLWQWSAETIADALTDGDAYVILSEDDDGRAVMNPVDAASTRMMYDGELERVPRYAARLWVVGRVLQDVGVTLRANLWYPDRVERYINPQGQGWEPYASDDGDWVYEHGFSRLPVVHLRTRAPYGRPLHYDAYGPQDMIVKLVMTFVSAVEYTGWPQRYLLQNMGLVGQGQLPGQTLPGQTASTQARLTATPGSLWELFGEAVGTFPAADLTKLTDGIAFAVRSMAQVTRTPFHYFDPSGDVPSGEALALDTRVPSPDGIKTMGELRAGDRVYDERGGIQHVVHAFAVMEGRPCFRVTFDDGTQIVADSDHKWLTSMQRNTKSGGVSSYAREVAVRTTAEVAASIHRKHFIEVAGQLDAPEIDLPVDPYTLGVWLGDGCCHHFNVIQHEDDADELVGYIRQSGQYARVRAVSGRPNMRMILLGPGNREGLCRRGHPRPDGQKCKTCDAASHRSRRYGDAMPMSLKETMRSLGLYRNKHIPDMYFQASHKQRLALLQGIMDTDGCPKKQQGSVELALSNETLARDVHRLIQSLGHKVALRSRDSKHRGRVVGTEWRMTWSAPDPVFRLGRKAVHQRVDWTGGERPGRSTRRYIRAVDPVPSVPVRCIEVSGPSHLYLVTDALVATHNSLRMSDAPVAATTGAVRRALTFGTNEMMSLALELESVGRVPVDTIWAPDVPITDREWWETAKIKHELGVSRERIWAEAGYTDDMIAGFATGEPLAPPIESE